MMSMTNHTFHTTEFLQRPAETSANSLTPTATDTWERHPFAGSLDPLYRSPWKKSPHGSSV
jgi:hypothetical protein